MAQTWFDKNPKKTFFFVILGFFLFLAIAAEVFLRFYINFNPSYYMAKKEGTVSTVLTYPYGIIKINQDGFPDKEFLQEKIKPRIAYIGDSVCFGVGTGYGYRVSDLLEKRLPEFEHMNMAFVDTGVDLASIQKTLELVNKYKLDKVVYMMNLNDILPTSRNNLTSQDRAWTAGVKKYADWIRGKSYLLTGVRYLIRDYYIRLGYRGDSYRAYELFPNQYKKVILETTDRISLLNSKLKEAGVELMVIILPYEMQISAEAEEVYHKTGAKWEAGFIDRGTQKIIEEELRKNNIKYIDAYYAFIKDGNIELSRKNNKVGQFFVYNLGDRLDWNHPNRAGHQTVADYLFSNLKNDWPNKKAVLK